MRMINSLRRHSCLARYAGTIFAIWLVTPVAAITAEPPPTRPNILFIMADDQAPWALGVSGNAQAKTPNMDRLARDGVYFPNAFTPTPVCSPSRASLLTSRYGSELGITDWINPQVERGVGLDATVPTWPSLLQQAGYSTALFGKWHVGDLDEQHPTKRGYGTFVGFRGGSAQVRQPILEKNGVTSKEDGFIVDLITDEAILWLMHHDSNKPFATSIHFREPHAPYLPVREEDWARVKDLDPTVPNPNYPGLDIDQVKKMTLEYLASVAAIDRNLGRILDALQQRKFSDNTLVIYTSDHGYNLGHNGIWHKGNGHWILQPQSLPPATARIPSGQRPNMFDKSIQVPMVLRWPGVIKPGTINRHTISHLDWLPTFARLGNATIPEGTTLRGRDLTPLLRGETPEWNDEFYAEYSTKHQSHTHMRMIRTTEWKLIRDFENEGRDELYHLAVDPDETQNLIADRSPETSRIVARLDARILAKMAELKDPVLPVAQQRIQR